MLIVKTLTKDSTTTEWILTNKMIEQIGIFRDNFPTTDEPVYLQNVYHEDFFYIYLYLLDPLEFFQELQKLSTKDKFGLLYACDFLDIQSLMVVIGKSIGNIMNSMNTRELIDMFNELWCAS